MNGERLSQPRITIDQLTADPYPFYAELRSTGPIVWVPELGMHLVTRYDDVRAILRDAVRFTTDSPKSLIKETFGEHMLTLDGQPHVRSRTAFQRDFMPDWIRDRMEHRIADAARLLLGSCSPSALTELRSAFASRLPIQVMLIAFGLPPEDEHRFRSWYDRFEAALANHRGIALVQRDADDAAHEMREHFRSRLERPTPGSLLDAARDLTPDEIVRNLSIIFFGGISTVEALILDATWALLTEPGVFQSVLADRSLIGNLLDETMRWAGPVQSATRFVRDDLNYGSVHLRAGEIVNCMIGAANRDPSEFPDPDRFDLHRLNARGHLGFAVGPHVCIGRRLARVEAEIAISELLDWSQEMKLVRDESEPPTGHEFRQPRRLTVTADPPPPRSMLPNRERSYS